MSIIISEKEVKTILEVLRDAKVGDVIPIDSFYGFEKVTEDTTKIVSLVGKINNG